ncbi:MAG: hypothetical protein ACE5QF_08150 [Thermoplasmata archaeon]
MQFFSDLFQMIFADVLCMLMFVIGLVLLVLVFLYAYIKRMLGWKIWLHRGK